MVDGRSATPRPDLGLEKAFLFLVEGGVERPRPRRLRSRRILLRLRDRVRSRFRRDGMNAFLSVAWRSAMGIALPRAPIKPCV